MTRQDMVIAGYNDTIRGLVCPGQGDDLFGYVNELISVLKSGKGHPDYNKGAYLALKSRFDAYGIHFELELPS